MISPGPLAHPNERPPLVFKASPSTNSLRAVSPRSVSYDGIACPGSPPRADPPGVLTKPVQRKPARAQMQFGGSRVPCSSCHRLTHCVCKKCTQESLSLYSKKENISQKMEQRRRLEEEVHALLAPECDEAAAAARAEERVLRLKDAIAATRARIDSKRREVAGVEQRYKNINKYATWLKTQEHSYPGIVDTRKRIESKYLAKLAAVSTDLSLRRKEVSLLLCGFLPVSEVEAQLIASIHRPDNRPMWSVVEAHSLMEGSMFKVRDAVVCARMLPSLGAALSEGPLSLGRNERAPFAALLHTVQLVNLLAAVYDQHLPYTLSLRDMSVCGSWSPALLETDWFKLCLSTLWLCLCRGLPPDQLKFSSPHSNLINLARYLLDSPNLSQLYSSTLSASHHREIEEAKNTLRWKERENLAEWDICEDIENLL